MKKIFLLLLLVVTAVATMRAQDEPLEQTAKPTIYVEPRDSYWLITVENSEEDPYAEIYLQVSNGNFEEFDVYYEPRAFDQAGSYSVLAFAVAPGKTASETVGCGFDIPQILVNTPACDFIEDGIYYQIKSDSTVWVSTREIIECSNDWLYEPHPADQLYSGNVIIPSSVEHDGKAYSVTGIAYLAFKGCNLSNVNLPNTIESISQSAFSRTKGLSTITLPESLIKIYHNAFWSCDDLTRVICKALIPPQAGGTAFEGQYYKTTLYVPVEVLEAYRTHEVWRRFKSIVPFIGVGPGDINGDGAIDIADVTILVDQLLSGEELPAYIDVNGSGDVNIGDLTYLVDMLLSEN